ncbi:unnamed protein product, partial [Closterium sp. NIES-54]
MLPLLRPAVTDDPLSVKTDQRHGYHPSLAAAATRASHFRSQSESAFAFDQDRSEGQNVSESESGKRGGGGSGNGGGNEGETRGGAVETSRYVNSAHHGPSPAAKVSVNSNVDVQQLTPLPASSRPSKPQSPLPRHHRRYRSEDAFSFHEPSPRAAADGANTAGSSSNNGSSSSGGGSRGGGVMTMVERGMQLLSTNSRVVAGKDGGRDGGRDGERGGKSFISSSNATATCGTRHATSNSSNDDKTISSGSAHSPTSPSDGNRDNGESTEAETGQQKSPGSTTSPTGSTRIARNTVVLSGAAAAARKRGSSRGGSICQELLPSLWEEEDERKEGKAAVADDGSKQRGVTGTPAEDAEVVVAEAEADITGGGDRSEYYRRRKSGSAIPRSRERWQAEDDSASAVPRVPSPTGLPPRPMSPSDADPYSSLQSRHAQMSPTSSPPNHRRSHSSGTFLWGGGMMGGGLGLPPTSPRTSGLIGRSKTTGGSCARVPAGVPLADVASLPRSRTTYAAMGEGGGGGGGGAGGGGRGGMGGEGRAAGGGGHLPLLNRGKGMGGAGGGVARSASSGNVAGMGQSGASMGVPRSASSGNVAGMGQGGAGMGVSGAGMGVTPAMGTMLDPARGGSGVPRSASSGNMAGNMGGSMGGGMGGNMGGMGFTPTMGTVLGSAGVPRSASSGNMGGMGGNGAGMGGSGAGMGGSGGGTRLSGFGLGSPGAHKGGAHRRTSSVSSGGGGGGAGGIQQHGYSLSSPGSSGITGRHRRSASTSYQLDSASTNLPDSSRPKGFRTPRIVLPYHDSISPATSPPSTSPRGSSSSLAPGDTALKSPYTSPPNASPRGTPPSPSYRLPPQKASASSTHAAAAAAAAGRVPGPAQLLGGFTTGATAAAAAIPATFSRSPRHRSPSVLSPSLQSPSLRSPKLRSPSLPSPGVIRTGSASPGGSAASNLVGFSSPTYLPSPASSASLNASSPYANYPYTPGGGSVVHSPQSMAALAERDKQKLAEIQSFFASGTRGLGGGGGGGGGRGGRGGKRGGMGLFLGPIRTPSPSEYYRLASPAGGWVGGAWGRGEGEQEEEEGEEGEEGGEGGEEGEEEDWGRYMGGESYEEGEEGEGEEGAADAAGGGGGTAVKAASGEEVGGKATREQENLTEEAAAAAAAAAAQEKAAVTAPVQAGEAARKEAAGGTRAGKQGKADAKTTVQAGAGGGKADAKAMVQAAASEAAKQATAAAAAGGGKPDVKALVQAALMEWRRKEEAAMLQQAVSVLGRGLSDVRKVYQLGKELGRGNFGVIREAVDWVSGERFACKSVNKKRLECLDDLEDLRREVEVMRLLKGHPNIVSLVDTYEDDTDVHMVMELCEGGELFDRIVAHNHFSERQAAQVCRTLADVLRYCHSHHILHRDLKPENVLLVSARSDTRVKVIDFGMAYRFQEGERCTQRAGTPNYISPEVIAKNYGTEADVWSLGVILYVMLCGLPPFWGDSTEEIFSSILYEPLDLETEPWPDVSAAAKDLVRRMLCRRFDERITVPEIL